MMNNTTPNSFLQVRLHLSLQALRGMVDRGVKRDENEFICRKYTHTMLNRAFTQADY